MSEKFIGPQQLGQILGVDSKTVTNWAKVGKIPIEIQEGRVYRFDLAKVKAALADRAQKEVAAK